MTINDAIERFRKLGENPGEVAVQHLQQGLEEPGFFDDALETFWHYKRRRGTKRAAIVVMVMCFQAGIIFERMTRVLLFEGVRPGRLSGFRTGAVASWRDYSVREQAGDVWRRG